MPHMPIPPRDSGRPVPGGVDNRQGGLHKDTPIRPMVKQQFWCRQVCRPILEEGDEATCMSWETTEQTMNIEIGPLSALDLANGYLETLRALASADVAPDVAKQILRNRLRNGLRTYVARQGKEVVGTATLL